MLGKGAFASQEVVVPLGLLVVVGCMLIPLPPALLDIFLCANLLFALLLVIGALHIKDPLRLATLPSLLLIATLVRLSLNLATTRAVLGSGHAGKAVEAFGSVVIQGNFIVGFVLFLLITLIQFIVVAKGAERVAEVSARFTLDALPGKQMAIDAEIRSGLLDPESARKKRQEVQMESRFYGALDGAMKFVKGDAIAGIVITFVNIVGGLCVGLLVHHLELDVAVRRYTMLTIGDGLLSQVPSLLNSVAAGLVVTRVQVNDSSSLSSDLLLQIGEFRAARMFVACASFVLACLPGMPHIALLVVAGLIGISLLGSTTTSNPEEVRGKVFEPTLSPSLQIEVSKGWAGALPPLSLLSDELEELRLYAFRRWGLVLQRPGISLWEEPISSCRVLVRGMDAWSSEGLSSEPTWSEVVLEIKRVIDRHRGDLIDDGVTRRTLDYVERHIPDLVSGVVPAVISLTQLTGVLRALLREEITIRHLDVILQTVAESGGRYGERAIVAEVRAALAPVVSATVARGGAIHGVIVDPLLDLALSKAEESGALLPGEILDSICGRIAELVKPGLVVIASKRARAYLRDLLRVRWGDLSVIAHEEIAPRYEVISLGQLEVSDDNLRSALVQVAV
jgi:type III secretion protein V